MMPYSPAVHRINCSIHVVARAETRGLDLTAADISRLERMIDRLRPAFERPGRDRYWITVKRPASRKFWCLYDTSLGCLVTVLNHRPRRMT